VGILRHFEIQLGSKVQASDLKNSAPIPSDSSIKGKLLRFVDFNQASAQIANGKISGIFSYGRVETHLLLKWTARDQEDPASVLHLMGNLWGIFTDVTAFGKGPPEEMRSFTGELEPASTEKR
jgi:hypothetical protein